MSNIFNLNNIDDFSEKINIDELYEKKRQHDLSKLELFNKMLNRIHVRIKTTSRQKLNEQFCWYLVPEIIIGVPRYDQAACIAFLLDKLTENGFRVQYIHPNALFISWNHWVPSYVRSELKKKTGIIVNETGEKMNTIENGEIMSSTTKPKNVSHEKTNPNDFILNLKSKQSEETVDKKTQYKAIDSYKPSGTFIYDKFIDK